jgi:hypothetical protein
MDPPSPWAVSTSPFGKLRVPSIVERLEAVSKSMGLSGSGTVCGKLIDVGAALRRDFSAATIFVGA